MKRQHFFWFIVVAFCACQNKNKTSSVVDVAQIVSSSPKVAASSLPSLDLSSSSCIGLFTEEPVREILTPQGRQWLQKGSTLIEKTHDEDDKMVVGVIADLKEDSPQNLLNIDKYVKFFKQEKVEMIFVVGDSGSKKIHIINNLRRLAHSRLPIAVMIGNRECQTDYQQAIQAVSARYPYLFDLNRVRHIIADDGEFITLPGYFNSAYMHCVKDGCVYQQQDVERLKPLVRQARQPLVLVSHGPPLQQGVFAIDRISDGGHVGDLQLSRFLQEEKVMFGFFANIHEAGGRASDLLGEKEIKPSTMVSSLYLNPGPADSMRWRMNDGSESQGMVAAVTFKNKQASYTIFRIANKRK